MTMETSPSIENLSAALGKFQAETHGVVRDATNPFLKNRYATLEAVIETARPALAKAGLAFLQAPSGISGQYTELITMLMHGASGEWIRFSTIMPIPKADPQGVGSAITYACRYALMAMLGLPPLDDDAEATKPEPQAMKVLAEAQKLLKTSPKPQPKQWKGEYVEGPPHKPDKVEGYHPPSGQPPPDLGYDPRASVTGSIPARGAHEAAATAVGISKQSKSVYIEKAIKRMDDMESAPELLQWAKDERKMVWPQYGIEPHDEGGQRLLKAYKDRMAELEKTDETEPEE
jgi:hypothetical protein